MSLAHRIAAASCLGAPWAFAAAAAERPNIILMVADDQGWNGLSVEMAPGVAGSRSDAFHTPNLEKLAAQGMRFSNAYAPAPVCSPTRISLQTGRSPAALHWTKAAPPEPGHRLLEPTLVKQIADGETTIGEVLKKAGYATAHYGKWHIAGGGPGRHGYDEHDGDTGNENASQFTDPNPVDIFGMADRAEAFMARSHRAGRPFFIQLSWNALHAAENARKATLAKYEQQLGGAGDKRTAMAAITEDLDAGVGRVVEAIDRLGLAGTTYVIYTSDNGAGGGEAAAHPWHRHRENAAAAQREPKVGDDAQPADPGPSRRRFILTAAPRKPEDAGFDIAAAFAPFEKLDAVTTRRDERWFYVESNGIPDHPLMVGIRAWQQQVPLPQPYVGDNAWQIPLHPVRAKEPASTRNRFLRGAIALAVNGIPIFNPLNNRGEDAFAIGELDEYGGHCGRADDYHYHIAPMHLEKVVGKGKPIAFALDGYPVYGATEPDGSPMKPLDALGGHDDGHGGYHYHAMQKYPYLIGGFRGEVVERDGQVDPQPRAQPVREALGPLRGATIVGFESLAGGTRRVVYEVGGRKGAVEYTVAKDGSATFTFTDPSGRSMTESYTPRGPGGGSPRQGQGLQRRGRGPQGPPPPGDRPARDAGAGGAASVRLATKSIAVTSPAFGPDERLPVEFTCDGAGVSPPVEWQAGPSGTQSYALTLWHESPDGVKSYWMVYDIPADVTKLPKNVRSIGTLGLNGKRRAEYDPMCSKGPGVKEYHITVYALSARPQLRPETATREALLKAVAKTVLAEGTLSCTYERQGRR